MQKSICNLMALCCSVLFFSACISQDKTVYRDVERTKVDFENETAGRVFYETLNKLPHHEASESKSAVSIPIVFEVKRRYVRSENFAFNDAVANCDTNRDGNISEKESHIFASTVH